MKGVIKIGGLEKIDFQKARHRIYFIENYICNKDFWDKNFKEPQWQQNHTPFPLVKKMIDKVEDLDDKKIGVLFNLEFLEELVKERGVIPVNITFYADTEIEEAFARNVYKVKTVRFKEHTVKGLNKAIMRKFDLVISNPPYNRGIDLNILNEIYDQADEFIIVHPSTWLMDNKCKNSAFNKVRDLVKDGLKEVTLFNGNKIFGIGLFVPCSITHIDKTKKHSSIKVIDTINQSEYDYNDIFDIDRWGNKPQYNSLKNKVLKFTKKNSFNKHSYKEANIRKNVLVKTACIRGHVDLISPQKMIKDDFFTILSKNDGIVKDKERASKLLSETRDTFSSLFYFDKKCEAENFIAFCKTKLFMFCLSVVKINQNNHRGELNFVPWLDFTQNWNDEKLYKYFKLTQEEIDFIETNIPDYYGVNK